MKWMQISLHKLDLLCLLDHLPGLCSFNERNLTISIFPRRIRNAYTFRLE